MVLCHDCNFDMKRFAEYKSSLDRCLFYRIIYVCEPWTHSVYDVIRIRICSKSYTVYTAVDRSIFRGVHMYIRCDSVPVLHLICVSVYVHEA